jgi:hypothetical protein
MSVFGEPVRPTAIRDAALLVDQPPVGVLGIELIMDLPDRLGADETDPPPDPAPPGRWAASGPVMGRVLVGP